MTRVRAHLPEQMLAQFDKNKKGKIELTEVPRGGNNEIMYRIFKSVDKNTGNDDGVVRRIKIADRADSLTMQE